MRVVYFDCFAGISGDMTLGALVDIGVDIASLRHELAKLPLSNYTLEAHTVKRGGFRGTHVRVLVDEMAQPSRRYTDIVRMLAESTLDSAVQESALEVFRRLGEVEARLHDEPLETIHFHEVGAVDSIVDVVGAVIGLQALGVDLVLTSPITQGMAQCTQRTGSCPCQHRQRWSYSRGTLLAGTESVCMMRSGTQTLWSMHDGHTGDSSLYLRSRRTLGAAP